LQLRLWHLVRNVLSTWFVTAATLAVGFFLSPFVVHRLGNAAYGVWILAIFSVNYLLLFDMGMRSSILRYVSKGHTTQDHQSASEVISAVLWVRLLISAVVLLFSGILAAFFPTLFKVPPSLVLQGREAVLIIGVSTAIGMAFGVFSGVVSALNRYDLHSLVSVAQLAIRVLGTVAVLLAGHGIVAIALCELVAMLVRCVWLALISRRIYPDLRITLKIPNREVLRKIWSYSAYAFLLTVASQLVYQTDNLVVGAFVSAVGVTFYSIGNSLCRYTQQIVESMTGTFIPAASTYESGGNTAGLRSLYVNGTRLAVAVSSPILITFLVRGRTFIGLWMGPQYSHTSGVVLAILASALLFSLSNSTASAIAWGIEKHKRVAKWAVLEAVANLTLSVVLAIKIGIYGVAIGTLVPSLVIHLIFWPRYVPHLVGITPTQVYRDIWAPVYLCSIPYAVASYLVDRFYPPRAMALFAIQIVLLLPLLGCTLALVFRKQVKLHMMPRLRSFILREQNT
jgi:O-antigen/teichoic acid export membrane protein